uniref:ATP synthase complex subunit 8 n=2 Tax=Megalagrion TaxID=218341 RepID=Q85BL8_9ODON|nr:ATP synthase F0 subunit 8 [Megalagrion oresitrophum]AAO34318.1 ATP synthase F0 subunit 8 [Megalagrion oresitrophum]AAO34327.1 ATP synthase F0 subunit 8 [Megalagrion orobates]
MPQMAPMSWLLLFMFFTASLLFIMTINYYLYLPKVGGEDKKEDHKSKTMNWK